MENKYSKTFSRYLDTINFSYLLFNKKCENFNENI